MNDQSNLPVSMQDGGPPRLAPLPAGGIPTAIVPRTFEEVYRLAGLLASSGLTPYGMNTPEKCAVALMHGLELGLKPMQAIQSIAVIGGRPTIWGDVAMAMIRASGELEEFEEEYVGAPYDDNYTAVCTMKRKGQKPITRRFTVAQAKLAGLWTKTNRDGSPGVWMLYPDRMLMRRARSLTQTDGWQDVLKGFSITEDLQDAIDVTPTAAAPAAPVAAERPRITRGKKAAEPVAQGSSEDISAGSMQAAKDTALPPENVTVVDEAHTTTFADERTDEQLRAEADRMMKDGEAQQQGDGDFDDAGGNADPDWDEVKQHFKADLLACTDVGSCEAALEGLLGRYDGIPADVERVVCETHDERVKQIAEAAQLRLAAEQKKAEKVTDRAVAERAADANAPKKTFASTAEAEKAIEGVLSKLRQSKSTQQLQGVWDSHAVPFVAEYELAASDMQGIEQVFNARKKILGRKEG